MRLTTDRSNGVVIEAEIDEPVDVTWVHGRLRLRVGDETIGDWGDLVALRPVTRWLDAFADMPEKRWEQRLEGLEGEPLFRLLADHDYGEPPDDEIVPSVFARYFISHLGLSAFDDFDLILVEPPGRDQRLLWRRCDAGEGVREARLPAGALQRAAAEFVRLMVARLPRLLEEKP